jgi:hypothetical protein
MTDKVYFLRVLSSCGLLRTLAESKTLIDGKQTGRNIILMGFAPMKGVCIRTISQTFISLKNMHYFQLIANEPQLPISAMKM